MRDPETRELIRSLRMEYEAGHPAYEGGFQITANVMAFMLGLGPDAAEPILANYRDAASGFAYGWVSAMAAMADPENHEAVLRGMALLGRLASAALALDLDLRYSPLEDLQGPVAEE